MCAKNFNQRAWSAIVTSLGLDVKEGINMTLYNCRDTLLIQSSIKSRL